MKPRKWDEMPEKKGPIAVKPLNSNRGQSVMGHALETAIQWMGIDPQPEKNNIEDLEVLLEILGLSRTQPMDIGVRAVCIGERNSE
ncbi:MAG: hypothetical protein IIB03_10230 [Acidobacteria bacterium]|nr:hypothetical protein [Acidobacteriota bacterium]